ncbi:MAG TPA: dihydrolipoyl dehydrogenase [Acidimicrobiia bacterium]
MSTVPDHYDVVVLGGGPGGYAAALYGASAGLSIAMIEERDVGGTCLHRGCIPAKELLQTAEVLRTVRDAKEFGVDAGQPTLDLGTSLARKQQVVDRLTKGLETLLKGRKVTIVPGTGTITDAAAHIVEVDGAELQGDALIIATGSSPRPLPGLDFDGAQILSSDHVLELDQVPARTAIIGGGAIGCEFASYLSDVGSTVTVLEMLPGILPGVDSQASDVVARAFRKRGIKVLTGVQVDGVDRDPVLAVRYQHDGGPDSLEVDAVVVSIGRSPRSEGLAGTGIQTDDRGYVIVDDHMRTSVPGVYAAGDVVATPALAHVGFAEAIVAIKTIVGDEQIVPVDYDKVPWGIYCHPEVAFAGLTEAVARERGYDVVTSVERFGGNPRALIIGEPEGLVKIVAERDGPVLGVHIAGPWATELLTEGYLAVNWEATPADIGALIHPHPTLSELFGEAALALTGRSLHG